MEFVEDLEGIEEEFIAIYTKMIKSFVHEEKTPGLWQLCYNFLMEDVWYNFLMEDVCYNFLVERTCVTFQNPFFEIENKKFIQLHFEIRVCKYEK